MIVAYFSRNGTRIVVDGAVLVPPDTKPDIEIDVGDSRPFPGLINSHDHLQLNHFPRLGSPPYETMYDWANDIQERFAAEIAAAKLVPAEDALKFGALKNLLGGATTVVHHDTWHEVLDSDFPVKLARVGVAHSLGFEADIGAIVENTTGLPLCMHIAEGRDPSLASEITSASEMGLLNDKFLAAHAIATDRRAVEMLTSANAAVIWCPSSNFFLYNTTITRELAESGVDIMLGTDSLLSGSGTILEEISAAARTGLMDNHRLVEAVTTVPARRLGLPDRGALGEGLPADVLFLDGDPTGATAAAVRAVLVNGKPMVGRVGMEEMFEAHALDFEGIDAGFGRVVTTRELADTFERVTEIVPARRQLLNASATPETNRV